MNRVHLNSFCPHNDAPTALVRLLIMQGQYRKAMLAARQLRAVDELSVLDAQVLHVRELAAQFGAGLITADEIDRRLGDVLQSIMVERHYDLAADVRAFRIVLNGRYNPDQDYARQLEESFFEGGLPATVGNWGLLGLAQAQVSFWRQGADAALQQFAALINSLHGANRPCLFESASRYYAHLLRAGGNNAQAAEVLRQAHVDPAQIQDEVPHYRLE